MNIVARLFGSTLGKKYIMAVTGAAMVLFVTAHMIGNLQLFLGPEALNRYAHFLQSNIELLWPARLGLLAMVALHVWAALTLSLENKAARPVEYGHGKSPFSSTLASRTMLGGGAVIALFIVFHLLHYTVCAKAVNFTGIDFTQLHDAEGRHDVYAMVVYGFGVWYVAAFYIFAVGCLAVHLSHGIGAMFQSLGWRNHAWWPVISQAAKIWAVVLFLGYAVVPGAVLAGYGKSYVNGLTPLACCLPASVAAPAGQPSDTPAATNAPAATSEEAK